MALEHMIGGAVAGVGVDDTAFGSRAAEYNLLILGSSDDPGLDKANRDWARRVLFVDEWSFTETVFRAKGLRFYETEEDGKGHDVALESRRPGHPRGHLAGTMSAWRDRAERPLNDTVFYFAYGSNADPERFRARVGAWRSRRRARLPDHRLRFARMVQSEGGGGAVVDECPGRHVDGVLFEITPEQLEAMDREEFDPSRDVAATGKRIRRMVETAEGPLQSQLYTVDDDGGFSPPSPAYLGHILRGLVAAGHDEAALAEVRAAAAEAAKAG